MSSARPANSGALPTTMRCGSPVVTCKMLEHVDDASAGQKSTDFVLAVRQRLQQFVQRLGVLQNRLRGTVSLGLLQALLRGLMLPRIAEILTKSSSLSVFIARTLLSVSASTASGCHRSDSITARHCSAASIASPISRLTRDRITESATRSLSSHPNWHDQSVHRACVPRALRRMKTSRSSSAAPVQNGRCRVCMPEDSHRWRRSGCARGTWLSSVGSRRIRRCDCSGVHTMGRVGRKRSGRKPKTASRSHSCRQPAQHAAVALRRVW